LSCLALVVLVSFSCKPDRSSVSQKIESSDKHVFLGSCESDFSSSSVNRKICFETFAPPSQKEFHRETCQTNNDTGDGSTSEWSSTPCNLNGMQKACRQDWVGDSGFHIEVIFTDSTNVRCTRDGSVVTKAQIEKLHEYQGPSTIDNVSSESGNLPRSAKELRNKSIYEELNLGGIKSKNCIEVSKGKSEPCKFFTSNVTIDSEGVSSVSKLCEVTTNSTFLTVRCDGSYDECKHSTEVKSKPIGEIFLIYDEVTPHGAGYLDMAERQGTPDNYVEITNKSCSERMAEAWVLK